MLIQLMLENPIVFLLFAVSIVLSLTVHEFAHALVADKLGDSTPRSMGRVTLNPLAHLDPIGTLVLLFAGFGWGKPVQINLFNLANPKRDNALISAAGPLSNFLLAFLLAIISRFVPSVISIVFQYMIFINLSLCFFNLIPLFPLDGEKVVSGLLPIDLQMQWHQIQQYGTPLLLLLVFTNSVQYITEPLINLSMKLLGLLF